MSDGAGFECFICGFKAENVTVAEASKIAAAHKHPKIAAAEGYLERETRPLSVSEVGYYVERIRAVSYERDTYERLWHAAEDANDLLAEQHSSMGERLARAEELLQWARLDAPPENLGHLIDVFFERPDPPEVVAP